jgi:hypothetical protein
MDKCKKQIEPAFLILVPIALAALLTGCHGPNKDQVPNSIKGAGTCGDPIMLQGTTTLDNESTAKAGDSMSAGDPACLDYETHGSDQIYRITVPAKDLTKFRVIVTPSQTPGADAFDPVVYVTETCGGKPQCEASDSRGGGGPEVLEYVNTSGQAKDLFVAVDGYDFQPSGGSYKLEAALVAP